MDLLALVAHEVGHAVAEPADEALRYALGEELAAEVAANAVAFRWGFGPEIRRKFRRHREIASEGPLPGQAVDIPGVGRFVMRPDFRLAPLGRQGGGGSHGR